MVSKKMHNRKPQIIRNTKRRASNNKQLCVALSKKGHAPYNPRKKNQDALIMADDPNTNSLILAVLDGHGEHGDYVSAWFRDQLISEMFNHPSWVGNLKVAVADAVAKVERELLRNFRIDTEFSGTTLSMAIVRGNQLTGVNIG